MVRAPLHFHGRIPVPEVAPLTYRDGVTHLELVYELSQYLKKILHPSLQSTVEQVVADTERLLSEANEQYVDGVEEFQRIHDRFMSDVNASLIALNDTAVTDLVDDKTSLLGASLRNLVGMYGITPEHAPVTLSTRDDTETLQWLLDNAHTVGGRVFLPPGNYEVSETLTITRRTQIVGSGYGDTRIRYTGTGPLFDWHSPGERKYQNSFSDLHLMGPGSDTDTVGVLMDSVSSTALENMVISGFGVGVNLHSPTSGFTVYNRFTNVTTQQCSTGFLLDGYGANGNVFMMCRANICGTGFHIEDGNENNIISSQIEMCDVGIDLISNSASSADKNTVFSARFERNEIPWRTSTGVRFLTMFNPRNFGAYNTVDEGEGTYEWGGGLRNEHRSNRSNHEGSWLFERTAHGADERPAMLVRDANTATGTPVTIQARNARSNGILFRGQVGGDQNVFDVDAYGNIKIPGRNPVGGGYIELTARSASPQPVEGKVLLFVSSQGHLRARMGNGQIVTLVENE